MKYLELATIQNQDIKWLRLGVAISISSQKKIYQKTSGLIWVFFTGFI